MKIEIIDYGIAFTVEEGGKKWIQVNKALFGYPKLLDRAIQHEIGHLKRKGVISNLLYDIVDSFRLKNSVAYWKFCIKHPRALMASMPFYLDGGRVVYNLSSIAMLILLFASIVFFFWRVL
jgi:hypothetical protein